MLALTYHIMIEAEQKRARASERMEEREWGNREEREQPNQNKTTKKGNSLKIANNEKLVELKLRKKRVNILMFFVSLLLHVAPKNNRRIGVSWEIWFIYLQIMFQPGNWDKL